MDLPDLDKANKKHSIEDYNAAVGEFNIEAIRLFLLFWQTDVQQMIRELENVWL